MKKKLMFIPLIVLLLAQLACGSSSEGTKVGEVSSPTTQQESAKNTDTEASSGVSEEPLDESQNEPEEASPSPAPQNVTFKLGDIIELKGHQITLIEVALSGNVLKATFFIENMGDSDISVSSIMSFSAKKDDGTKLEQEMFDCSSSGLDGTILPGDKLKGDICWSGVSSGEFIKLYYEASLFSEGATVWAINTATDLGKVDPPVTSTELQVSTHKVGDIIEVQGQTIVLNSVETSGSILKANFTIENKGSEDIAVSSLMSFTAKDSTGTKLEQEFFNCGSSSLDGEIIPGDKLRGDICWSLGSDPDVKLYYEAGLFTSGAVVWTVAP